MYAPGCMWLNIIVINLRTPHVVSPKSISIQGVMKLFFGTVNKMLRTFRRYNKKMNLGISDRIYK